MPVNNVAMDLSDLFPEAAPEKTTTLFDSDSPVTDISSLDKGFKEEKVTPEAAPIVAVKAEPASEITISSGPLDLEDLISTEQFEQAKEGTKSDLIDFFRTKIESGELTAFDDYDESKTSLNDYLKGFKKKDFDELWKSNADAKTKEIADQIPQQFFDSLPAEMQYAARYIQDGGQDMKSLFKALSAVEEVKALDPVKDARALAEQYLMAKSFGTQEDITEQLDEWDDLGITEKKAAKFKPELDKMSEQILQGKIAAQSRLKEDQKMQSDFYHENVREALRTEDLSGIRLDKKTQIDLYRGLTDFTYTDSRGKRCTEFEHLLDKIMWKEPDYKLLAEAQWLLKDPAGYKKALNNIAVNASVEETVRTLKTEQARTRSVTVEASTPQKKTALPRSGNMFRR